MARSELTLKQQKFIKFYIQLGNATEAARQAGYTSKHIDRQAYNLMTDPKVKVHLEKSREKVEINTGVTFDWKVNQLRELIHRCLQEEKPSDILIKAIAELNKMQGDLAPEKHINVNVSSTMDNLRTAFVEYKKEF